MRRKDLLLAPLRSSMKPAGDRPIEPKTFFSPASLLSRCMHKSSAHVHGDEAHTSLPIKPSLELGRREAADTCDCIKDTWGLERFLKLLFFPLLRRHSCGRKTHGAFGFGTRF